MNTVYALLSLFVVVFAFGFLVSIPMMKRQYRLHLDKERLLEGELHKLQVSKKVKVDKLKGKIQKLKLKLKTKKNS